MHVRRHAAANTPYFLHCRVTQSPIAFEGIAQIHHATSLRLQAFGRLVGEFCQGFRVGNAHANWNTRVLQDLGSYLPPKSCEVAGHAGQVTKNLVDVKERL